MCGAADYDQATANALYQIERAIGLPTDLRDQLFPLHEKEFCPECGDRSPGRQAKRMMFQAARQGLYVVQKYNSSGQLIKLDLIEEAEIHDTKM